MNPTTTDSGKLSTAYINQLNMLSNHLFSSDVHKADVAEFITDRYPQLTKFAAIMNKLKYKEKTEQDIFYWVETGRNRPVVSINSIDTGLPAATVQVTTDVVAATGYFIVGDIIRLTSDVLARVTVVGTNVTEQITMVLVAGGNFTTANLTTAMKITHLFNTQAELSDTPESRVYGGEKLSNKTAILRRTLTVSTSEFKNMTWVTVNGKKYWFYQNELVVMKEMGIDNEMYFMTGVTSSTSLPTAQSGFGMIPFVEANGVKTTYTAPLVESDLQSQMTRQIVNSSANEYLCLVGSNFFADVQRALKDYAVAGGITYGKFMDAGNTVGLNIQQYNFLGKILNFTHYMPFDDPTLLGSTSTGQKDYSHYCLMLDMGLDDKGKPLFRKRYVETPAGENLEHLVKIMPGMTSPAPTGSNIVSQSKDGFDILHYSYCGLEARAGNRHGCMYKV